MREKVASSLSKAFAILLSVAVGLAARADSLDTWSKRTSGIGLNLYGVAYGNGKYVCVGQSGVILVSTNGETWQTNNSGVANNLLGIVHSSGQFLAVGTSGLILRSTNAANWFAPTTPTTNTLNGIARCGDVFLAVGNSGTLLTSPDGISWTEQISGSTRTLLGAAFGNDLFLVVGGGQSNPAAALTSSNVLNWVDRSYANLGVTFYGVAFGNGVFVAMDARGGAFSSTNGTNWTFKQTLTSDYVFGIAHAQNVFVGVGGPFSGGAQKIVSSPDGRNWKLRPIATGHSGTLRAVAYGNGYFIAVGDKGLIVQSGPVSTLRLAGVGGGTATLALDGEMGRGYRIQNCNDLTASNWTDLLAITNTAEVTAFPDLQAGHSPLRFYRALSP